MIQTSWLDLALEGVEPATAERYRSSQISTFLDRTLQGVDDARKIDALRTIINLGMRPDDEGLVVAAVLGYLKELVVSVPSRIGDATERITAEIDRAVDEMQILPQIAKGVVTKTVSDAEQLARSTAERVVKAQALEEVEKQRIRLIAVSEDVMHEYLANAMAERSKWTRDPLVMRRAIIAAVSCVGLVLVGCAGGYGYGSVHPLQTDDAARTTAYGREFQEMYPTMPDAMRSWISDWVRRHPTP